MNFRRPQSHQDYFRLWRELVSFLPWNDAQALVDDPEELREWFGGVDQRDIERQAMEFVRHARSFFRKDLYGLMRFGLSHADRWHGELGCRWLDQSWLYDKITRLDRMKREGKLHRKWINWSRRHWKTTTMQALCFQEILNNQDIVIFYYSRTKDLAKLRISDISLEMEHNELQQRLFPDILWSKEELGDKKRSGVKDWSEESFTVKRKGRSRQASAQSTVAAYGVWGGLPTGGGCNMDVYDDVEDDANAHSLDMVQKTVRQVEQAIKIHDPSKPPLRIFVGTQYNKAGPMARLQERGFIADCWIESAVDWDRPNPELGPGGLDIGGHEPVLMTAGELEEMRGKGEEPWTTYCLQFLCRVDLARAQALDSTRMGTYSQKPWVVAQGGTCYILADVGGTPGTSPDRKLDDTAIWVIHLAADGMARIVDGRLDKMDMPTRMRAFFALHRRWSSKSHVAGVWIEESGAGGDSAMIGVEQDRIGYLFEVTRVAWGGAQSLAKKEREYEYISRIIDHLLAPPSLMGDRRGERVDLIANLRRQMDSLAETSDDHPLDALALLGAPPDKNVMRYRGKQSWEDKLGHLKWPSRHEIVTLQHERSVADRVSPENHWMLAAMGVSDMPESILER